MKDLIRQYVGLARTFSREACRYRAKDRENTATSHYFDQYLHNRSISLAYLHAARLAKKQMETQANRRAFTRQLGIQFRKAA